METRSFPTPVLASLSTGVLLCNFSDMHEAAEYLMGHPVWSHEFGSRGSVDNMKAKLLEQHPDLDVDATGVDKDNWEAFRDKLIADLGESREIVKGSEVRDKDPITTAVEALSKAS